MGMLLMNIQLLNQVMLVIKLIIHWFCSHMDIIVGDLWSFQLSIIGIAVSVMTLLFASHVGNVEAYNQIRKSKEINNQLYSINLSNSIKIYEKLNNKVLNILFYSCILFICSTIVKYISCKYLLFWMGLTDMLLTIILVIRTVLIIKNVVGQYKKETK